MHEQDPQAQSSTSSTKKTTVYHYRVLQEKFRDYTPPEGHPDYEEYCAYLALAMIEAKRASKPSGGGITFS
jgi:hypothetical protein